ncbi:MAG: NHL repeat-containing protein [Candidatus Nanopelagicales bacterium]
MTSNPANLSRRMALIVVSSAVVAGVMTSAPIAQAEPAPVNSPMLLGTDTSSTGASANTRGEVSGASTRGRSATLAKTGAGPSGIAVDVFGNVYTANSRSNNVTKITASGKSSILGTTGKKPRGIAVDPSGNVYTSNLGSNNVTKITPKGVSKVLGSTGNKPIDIALDSAGNVYTTNYGSNSVTKITPSGVSSKLGNTGSRPLGIVLDKQRNVFTANEGSNSVTKITPSGVSSKFGKTGSWPQGIAIDAARNIYTANWNSRNVTKITPTRSSTTLGRTGRRPIGIVVDPYGTVFTTNNGSNSVSQISRGGSSQIIARTGKRPIGIASDAAGFLYTANFGSNSVTEVFPKPRTSSGTIKLNTVTVRSPRNRDAWIIPFWNDVYRSKASCRKAFPAVRAAINQNADPAVQKVSATSCMAVGGVNYNYQIAETELTVAQWVTFLNTVDPMGHNRHRLWDAAQSSRVWPKYGSVNRNIRAPKGQRYYVASPEWANKPYNVADFTRAARLSNAIDNGRVSRKSTSRVRTVKGKRLVRTTYTIRLSAKTETGMYTMSNRKATRNSAKGFAVSSQDEWIKAAYFDPKGGGKHSYWDYPTNPGRFVPCPVDESGCKAGGQPNATQLNAKGNVTNAKSQPLASFESVPGVAPDWCPSQFTTTQCAKTPFPKLAKIYVGNMSSVGQARTRSPWGTLDQGGNVVEITDTISPPPPGGKTSIVWRRWHGGVVTATAYQMWLSAVGVTPQTVPGYAVNPWRGIRLVVKGK